MTESWLLLGVEFLINYWIHSTLFVGLVLIGLHFNWIKSDRAGEIIAKSALFAGVITAVLYSFEWRVTSSQLAISKLEIQQSEVVTPPTKDIGNLAALHQKEETNAESLQQSLVTDNASSAGRLKLGSKESSKSGSEKTNPSLAKERNNSSWNWWQVLVFSWLVGAGLIVLIRVLKIYRLNQFLSARKQIDSQKVIGILHRLTKRLRIRKPIILSELDTIQSPIVFGEREIILPNGFAQQYDDEQVEAALAHELGHILRKDSLWRKTIIFYNSLFYFQPLNQVLFTKINQIAEQRSDQFAEESTGNSRALAEALLITAKNNLTSSQNQWVPAMKSNKNQLLTRVEALLSSSVNRTQSSTVGLFLTFSLLVLIVLPGCSVSILHVDEKGNFSQNSYSAKIGTRSFNSHSNHNGIKTRTKAKLTGEIKLSEDETEILEFPEDSYLSYSVDPLGEKERKISIERAGNDDTLYKYYIDGEKTEFDAKAKKWLASVLPEMFRRTGLNVKERVARFKQRGGDEAVLEEIDLIQTDYVTGLYMKELLNISQLSSSNLSKLISRSESISSDFELANVLKVVISSQSLDDEGWQQLFSASQTIQSDFELANLLKQSVAHLSSNDKAQELFFEAASSIQSDFEMRSLFSEFLGNQTVNKAFLARMLKAAENIQSDFELAGLLLKADKSLLLDPSLFDAYLELSKSISSDFEMRRVFSNLINKDLSTQQLVSMVQVATEEISSDFELSSLLSQVAEQADGDKVLVDALYEASDEISSDSELIKLLKQLRGK
jgi:beta-lactamase regulating signal transducer with metallopeptidase domain